MNPQIIIGPPGCGKTHTLLGVAKAAVDSGVAPEDVGFVSFTRRAAHEGATRMGLPPSRLPHWRTIHSAAYRGLGLSPGDVLEGRRMQEFGDWAGVQLSRTPRETDRGVWVGPRQGDRMVHMENLARVRCKPLREQFDDNDDDLSWNQVEGLAGSLEYYKRKKYLLDYTDMLLRYADGVVPPRLHTLLVDEAQDLSLLQWRVVERMAACAENVVIAGDDDQAIYPWAGAAVEHFVAMPGAVDVLGQSWRVPSSTQAVAAGIIDGVEGRRPKQWAPRPEPGVLERAVGLDSVDLGEGHDILILARNHVHLERVVEPLLRREGVYYEVGGRPSVDRGTLESIVLWERLRRGEVLEAAAARRATQFCSWAAELPLQTCADDVPVNTTDLPAGCVSVWHDAMDRFPPEELGYVLAMRTRGEKLNAKPRVRLSTIHGAKGAEAEHVVLLMSQTPRVVRESARDPFAETRVWYVAVTRARQRLTLVRDPGGKREQDF